MATQFPTRKLGKNGPEVVGIGWGSMGLSAFYGPTKPDSERLALLDQLYEIGERNWDSADMYGDSEDLLGKWFAANPDKRKNIFLATKFANTTDAQGNRAVDSSPEYCKKALAKSLQRLGLDSVDLYYCHRLDRKTPIEKTVQAMLDLKNEGKIKYIGLSECSAASLKRASKVAHIDAVQVEYSPFELSIEHDDINLLRTARELGVAVVAYSPIGRGMLSGTYRSTDDMDEGDFRKYLPRFQPENFSKNLELVDRFADLAKKKNVTPTQLCLAWLMAQGDDIIPIPGSTNIDRIKENLGSLKVQLSNEEVQEIRKACNECETAGTRYPEAMLATTYADTPELDA